MSLLLSSSTALIGISGLVGSSLSMASFWLWYSSLLGSFIMELSWDLVLGQTIWILNKTRFWARLGSRQGWNPDKIGLGRVDIAITG